KVMFTQGPVALPGTKAFRAQNKVKLKPAETIKVAKATGADAHTIAEVFQGRASLSGKTVSVRGKVVKVSNGIMGNNWLHLQDGTGDASKGTNSLVVTTKDDAAVGDVVTATGLITPDKDFGFGYKYDVIMEQAKITK
ncbi:MAG: DNA-binding protein, partial [Nitrospirota bacterium]